MEHSAVTQSLNNLAALYDDQGKYAEAESLYQRALTISEKALGAEHPLVAQTLNNLAVLYDNQGRYAEEEQHLLRATQIDEMFPNPRYWLARLYQKRGRDGDREREIAEWKRYLELGPTSEERRNEAVCRLEDLSGQGRL